MSKSTVLSYTIDLLNLKITFSLIFLLPFHLPVEKVVESVLNHVGGGAVVEPGVELVDDRLEADHGEQPGGEAHDPCQSCT